MFVSPLKQDRSLFIAARDLLFIFCSLFVCQCLRRHLETKISYIRNVALMYNPFCYVSDQSVLSRLSWFLLLKRQWNYNQIWMI